MGTLKKYFVYVLDTEETILGEDIGSLTLSRRRYSGLLSSLSEHHALDAVLNKQNFRCASCRSFSLSAKALYSALEKIKTDDEAAEMLISALRTATEMDQGYLDLLNQPDEIVEKIFSDPEKYEEYLAIKNSLADGGFIVREGEIYRFPFDECVFVFDPACSCNHILHA